MSSLQTTYTGKIDDDFPTLTRFISFLSGSVLKVSFAEARGNTCWHQSLSLPALWVLNKSQGLSDTACMNLYRWITCVFFMLPLKLLKEKKPTTTTVQSNIECCLSQIFSAASMLWKGSLKKRGIFYFLSTGSSSYVEYETNRQTKSDPDLKKKTSKFLTKLFLWSIP